MSPCTTSPPNYRLVLIAALMGLFAVMLDAYFSHQLKGLLNEYRQDLFSTAQRYMLAHVPVILFLSLSAGRSRLATLAGWLLVAGLLMFSGSLHLLAVFEWRPWPMVTPVGGMLLIAGWFSLVIYSLLLAKDRLR
jgi:uncharacterized membrane protein YgdD (TMEM256/DUF423 family)